MKGWGPLFFSGLHNVVLQCWVFIMVHVHCGIQWKEDLLPPTVQGEHSCSDPDCYGKCENGPKYITSCAIFPGVSSSPSDDGFCPFTWQQGEGDWVDAILLGGAGALCVGDIHLKLDGLLENCGSSCWLVLCPETCLRDDAVAQTGNLGASRRAESAA